MRHDKRSDGEIWNSALFCWLAAGPKINGRYADGSIDGLAGDLNRERDTVEDRVHGYELFQHLCLFEAGKFRIFVFQCRTAPWIHFSHFRALYDLQVSFSLSDADIISTLFDIYQAEGGITSRNLEDHMRKKYGIIRDWTYYGGKACKALALTLGQPDLPTTSEEIGKLFEVTVEFKDGQSFRKLVVAYNPEHAEQVTWKELGKSGICGGEIKSKELDVVFSNSRHILNIASSWLGDNA